VRRYLQVRDGVAWGGLQQRLCL